MVDPDRPILFSMNRTRRGGITSRTLRFEGSHRSARATFRAIDNEILQPNQE
jgi:hypothetical protein